MSSALWIGLAVVGVLIFAIFLLPKLNAPSLGGDMGNGGFMGLPSGNAFGLTGPTASTERGATNSVFAFPAVSMKGIPAVLPHQTSPTPQVGLSIGQWQNLGVGRSISAGVGGPIAAGGGSNGPAFSGTSSSVHSGVRPIFAMSSAMWPVGYDTRNVDQVQGVPSNVVNRGLGAPVRLTYF